MKIAVIDDEINIIDGLRKLLKNEPYEVLTFSNPVTALETLENKFVDIIITDLMMPQLDGIDLMKKLRESGNYGLIIMITAYATINTALQASELGVFDYLSKPFTKEELLTLLNRATEFLKSSESEKIAKSIQEKKHELSECWYSLTDEGYLYIGINSNILDEIDSIQTIYLPQIGDVILKGSRFFQIFSSKLKSYNFETPFSGTIIEVNKDVLEQPQILIDNLNINWLLKIKPSRYQTELNMY